MTVKSLNILYHHRTQGRGAEGVHISSIVKSLEALGHHVTIVSPPGIDPMSNAGNAPIDKSEVSTKGINSIWKFISKNLPNFLFEIIEIIYNIPSSIRLEKVLSRKNYDIIYERYAFYMICGAIKAKKYNIPLILEANEVNGLEDRARKQSFPSLCKLFEKFLFKRCTSIHTVSSYLKNLIVNQGVDAEIIEVMPNAVDPDKFTGVKKTGNLKNELELNNKFVIGFAGWFDDWDRLDLLIDVFQNLKSKHKNLALLLVGDGAVLKQVREKVSSGGLSDVVLTGAVSREQVHQYISLLDIAVFTHSNDFGSPVVMFEFMGLKIPVVAPDLLPITDVMKDGNTALIFERLNMEQYQSKIEELILDKNLRENIANNAYKLLMNHHTWTKNAEKIVSSSGV